MIYIYISFFANQEFQYISYYITHLGHYISHLTKMFTR